MKDRSDDPSHHERTLLTTELHLTPTTSELSDFETCVYHRSRTAHTRHSEECVISRYIEIAQWVPSLWIFKPKYVRTWEFRFECLFVLAFLRFPLSSVFLGVGCRSPHTAVLQSGRSAALHSWGSHPHWGELKTEYFKRHYLSNSLTNSNVIDFNKCCY